MEPGTGNLKMHRDLDRYRMIARRTLVLGGMKVGLLGLLVGRLYYLQVIEAERFRMLADENRISLRLVMPTRGIIVDRFGVPLAVNEQNFRVTAIPEQTRSIEAALDKLAQIITLTDTDRRRILRDCQRKRPFVPVAIKDNVTWEQMARLEVNTPELPGVQIEVGELRQYPFAEATAHILGYVGAVAEAELTGDPVLALPGFRIGKGGIEKQHEKELRGVAGTIQLEVNSVGRVIRELERTDGQPGREITLTIDLELQKYAQNRLAQEQSAAAVLIDVHTGGIYALASAPGYDPNQFSSGIDAQTWRELITNPVSPLTNKTTAGEYAPGSTFKMMVGLAALEAGTVSQFYTAYCPGFMTLGDHRFHCWKKGGHGAVALADAIEQSCDVYFYDLARRVGVDRIAQMCQRFGLGGRLGVDLPAERPGLIPTRAWKQARYGRPWQPGETLVAGIGQGYVLATPLQLAVMTARLCNGGFAVKPHLTKHIRQGSPEQTVWPSIGVRKLHLDLIVDAMTRVTMSPRGTAHKARIMEPGFEMGGKTGTSQVRRISVAERSTGVKKNQDRPWRERDHALFVGFAPIQAPRYATAVIVEHGGGGSAIAAPIARDLLLECQRRDPTRTTRETASMQPLTWEA